MAGLSPARRLPTKTSDITHFFRGSGQSSSQQRQGNDASTGTLEVPLSESEGAGGSKKKITRIPLFGRSRKKSNHSTTSSPSAASTLVRDSSDLGDLPSRGPSTDRASERRPSEPSLIDVASSTTSKVPTLTSKFAAHFSHSRSSKTPSAPQPVQASPLPSLPVSRPSALSPHGARNASFESGTSAGRSITPRPEKPRITVSLSPDNLEGFQDLFTRETPTSTPISETGQRPNFSKQLKQRPEDADDTPRSSRPPSPRSSPEVPIYRRGHTPASAIAAAVRDRQTKSTPDERSPSVASRNSRKNSDSDKSDDKHDGTSTPRQSSREPPRFTVSEKAIPPSLHRRTSVATGSSQPSEITSSALRSRMKQPSSPARSRPPSMPLPLPPTPSTPPPEVPESPKVSVTPSPRNSSQISGDRPHSSRPRAHTIGGSISSAQSIVSQTPSRPISSSPEVAPIADVEVIDIEIASTEQLRRALRNRNKHIDELTAHLLRKEQEWSAERKGLDKKITTLQRDLMRRESEITGLKLIINDEDGMHRPKPLPPGISNRSRLSPTIGVAVDSDQETHSSSRAGHSRRLYYQSDSGNESQVHSGAESLRASGGSGAESVSSRTKIRRPFGFSDITQSISRSGSSRRSSKLRPGVTEKALPETPYVKRSSMASSSSSPSSSTSSLLPPSPSITMSSLSAIPEGPPSSHLRPTRYDSDQQEDRRAFRASNRTSTSSMTSSSTAASSGYSIKRSRPTSIAQVLEKSPNMDDVLEKLRPFA